MLSGSALVRVLLLIAAVGGLIGFSRQYWPSAAVPQEKPAVGVVSAPSAPLSRRPAPEDVSQSPQRAADAARVAAAPRPSPLATETGSTATVSGSLFGEEPATREVPAPAAQPSPSPSPAPRIAGADRQVAAADDSVVPRALDLVDLNTGSLAELNALKGAGAVGRAIIQHRPYGATDQLLSKRVLSRAIYQRVRDQVTVR